MTELSRTNLYLLLAPLRSANLTYTSRVWRRSMQMPVGTISLEFGGMTTFLVEARS